jgi:hypothetical protein
MNALFQISHGEWLNRFHATLIEIQVADGSDKRNEHSVDQMKRSREFRTSGRPFFEVEPKIDARMDDDKTAAIRKYVQGVDHVGNCSFGEWDSFNDEDDPALHELDIKNIHVDEYRFYEDNYPLEYYQQWKEKRVAGTQADERTGGMVNPESIENKERLKKNPKKRKKDKGNVQNQHSHSSSSWQNPRHNDGQSSSSWQNPNDRNAWGQRWPNYRK